MSKQQSNYDIQWMTWFAKRNTEGLYLSGNSDIHYHELRKDVAQTLGTQFKTVTDDDINYVFERCTEMADDIVHNGKILHYPDTTRYSLQRQIM